ncbi:MAG: hypothetical protein NVS2B4_22620 [Ramlibacter sp.]
MLIRRTDRGYAELRSRERVLGIRERGALFLLDAPKQLDEVAAALGPRALDLMQSLLASGHVAVVQSNATVQPAAEPAPSEVPKETLEASAPDARRSSAEARVFLFGLCERMFVRRSAADAERFRCALREARDAVSMTGVADEMFERLEQLTDADQAAMVREQFAALLPEGDRIRMDSHTGDVSEAPW